MHRFQPLIAGVVMRVAERYGQTGSGVVDELVQETFMKLCRNDSKALKEFRAEHEGAVFGFLKTVALNVEIDHFRSLQPRTEEPLEDWQATAAESSEGGTASAEMSVLMEQVDGALTRSTTAETRERDRTVFWLYYKHGFTAKAIAALPAVGLSIKGVETVIFRLTKAIRKSLNISTLGK